MLRSCLRKLLTFLNELFSFTPSSSAIQKSITGEPLLEFHDHGFGNGWSLKRTDAGMNGCLLNAKIDMYFPQSLHYAKAILKGDLDYCLQQTDKDALVAKIRKNINAGVSRGFEQTAHNRVEIVERIISSEDRFEILKLLEAYDSLNISIA